MITPIEVPMPDEWTPRGNIIDKMLDKIAEEATAKEFIEFQKRNKSGKFFEGVDQKYQEEKDALAEGGHEQAILNGNERYED